jgi:pyruvate formate lyase activating enzyme
MRIGGFQKFSLIDFPGKISAIVFTQGCNFRCPYCHNPELVDPRRYSALIPEEQIFDFLLTRKGKLEALSITGGEPTLQPDLLEFIKKVRKMGFLIKLDTNGTNPQMLNNIIQSGLVDYLAMDIKAPIKKYSILTGSEIDESAILQSISLIENSGVDYEFRSTLVKHLLTPDDVLDMGIMLRTAKRYFLQKFVPSKTLDKGLEKLSNFSQESLNLLVTKMQGNFGEFIVR